MFPKEEDPKGEPEAWTETEMKRWLNAVGIAVVRASSILGMLIIATEKPHGRQHSDTRRATCKGQGEHAGSASLNPFPTSDTRHCTSVYGVEFLRSATMAGGRSPSGLVLIAEFSPQPWELYQRHQ